MIYFITGNANKFSEAKAMIPDLEQLDLDLPEIQETDPRKIIEEKLKEARKHHSGEFVVEDTSLCLDCLGGLPGPFIKWFVKTIGNDGLANMAEKLGDNQAITRVMVGHIDMDGEINYFEGTLSGTIVKPRGDLDFGWGPIFVPEGHDKTFGEMERVEKNSLSMRKIAFGKLNEYLESKRNG
ncbi:MAG: non-canonical purine NTP pyrophosphatase [Patescibacteria group bacterium]